MSKVQPQATTPKNILPVNFRCRNIKKDYSKPYEYKQLTEQRHLELGENNSVVVVDDRPTDWLEFVNNNVDKVGLVNVLELARRRGESLAKFSFKDEEALDLGTLDPMNPQAVNEVLSKQEEAANRLAGIAKQLGVSVDELVKSFMDGTFDKLVAEKTTSKTTEVKEGEENA